MKKEDFDNLTKSMQEKLGKEASAKIADDIGKLITDNTQMNNEISKRDNEINKLKQDKENLIATNSSLLQQVGMSTEDFSTSKKPKEDEVENKPFSFKSCFDEKGNFKK